MSWRIYTAGDTQFEVVQSLTDEQSAADGLTATAGGVQATALLLGATHNNVSVCATAADAVKLPLAVAGLRIFIRNNGAASMQVFGSGTDTINLAATATGVAQANGKGGCYFCTLSAPAGKWQQMLGA